MKKFIILISCFFMFGKLSAQNTKNETINAAEILQSSRPDYDSVKTDNSRNNANQEPVKTENQAPKNKSAATPVPAPASTKKSDNSNTESGTQKMAITEQGIDKNKKKKAQSAASNDTIPLEKKDK